MNTSLVTLRDVTVVRETADALMCRIEEHVRWIPLAQLQERTTIRQKGDVGVLVIPREFAAEWGLTPYDSGAPDYFHARRRRPFLDDDDEDGVGNPRSAS